MTEQDSAGAVYVSCSSSSDFPDLASPSELRRSPAEGACPNRKCDDCTLPLGQRRTGETPWGLFCSSFLAPGFHGGWARTTGELVAVEASPCSLPILAPWNFAPLLARGGTALVGRRWDPGHHSAALSYLLSSPVLSLFLHWLREA